MLLYHLRILPSRSVLLSRPSSSLENESTCSWRNAVGLLNLGVVKGRRKATHERPSRHKGDSSKVGSHRSRAGIQQAHANRERIMTSSKNGSTRIAAAPRSPCRGAFSFHGLHHRSPIVVEPGKMKFGFDGNPRSPRGIRTKTH